MSKKVPSKKPATASEIKTKPKKTTVTAEDLFWEAYKEKQQEELLGDNSPSKIKSKVWLYAVNENAKYPLPTIDSGKWCVFVNKDEHDLWWGKIKEFLLSGGLGNTIKTNTAIVNPNATSKNKSVIIVYTYDVKDVDDVMRIRKELKELGIIWKMPYKTDRTTRERKYEHKGDTKISTFYE